MNAPTIPGYRYGDSGLARSPIDVQELKLIQASLLMTDDDIAALRRSKAILEAQTDAILDVWYGFVGSQPQLLHSFTNKSGEPNGDYLTKVRARFGKWIADTAEANYDRPGSLGRLKLAAVIIAPARTRPTALRTLRPSCRFATS